MSMAMPSNAVAAVQPKYSGQEAAKRKTLSESAADVYVCVMAALQEWLSRSWIPGYVVERSGSSTMQIGWTESCEEKEHSREGRGSPRACVTMAPEG